MRLWWRFVAVVFSSMVWSSFAQAAPPAYLRDMPSVEQVRAKVHGDDELDTQARLCAAFRQLISVVWTLSAGGTYRSDMLPPDERALTNKYGVASAEALNRGMAIIAASGAPKTGPESPSPKMTRLVEHYKPDSMTPWILDDFPSVASAFYARRGKDQRSWTPGGPIDFGIPLAVILLAALTSVGLLVVVLYPVVRMRTYPDPSGALPISGFRAGNGRYELTSFTGVLENMRTSQSTNVYISTNQQGFVDRQEIRTTYDHLELRDAQGNARGFKVADFHVEATPGHWLTVVSARKGRGDVYHLAVIDRTRGTGFFRYRSWGLFLGGWHILGSLLVACWCAVPLAYVTFGLGLALPIVVPIVLWLFTQRNIARVRNKLLAPA